MRRRSALILALALALSLLVPAAVAADSEPATFDYLIGTGFLCGLDESACPAISRAPNGDTVEVRGAGTITVHSKSASGAGTFKHNFVGGGSVSGTWTADSLMSFQNYGSGEEQGLPAFFFGGRAIIGVTLTVGTFSTPGTMWVDCLLGDKIPAGAVEGIRLSVPGIINFNKEVSGFTVFVED